MVTTYPNFYLLSDLDPKTDTTHGLQDFLSHVKGEIQVGYLAEGIRPQEGITLWRVYVDDDCITTMPTTSTDGLVFPYLGLMTTHFLPALGDLECWKQVDVEAVPADQSWSWRLNSKRFPSCLLRMEPVAIREEGYTPMSYDFSGIELNGVPVTDGDIEMDFDNEGIAVTLTTRSSEDHVIDGQWQSLDRAISVQLPAMFTGKTWAKAKENGTMKVERTDTTVKLTLPGGIVVTATKEGGNIAKCLVEEAATAEAYSKEQASRESFFAYMDDSSYELTISGAPALRSAIINEDNGYLYTIYVQDEHKVTTYRVYEALSCSECKEDGEFKKLVENGVDCAAFKIGLYSNEEPGGCEPVIAIFKKNS